VKPLKRGNFAHLSRHRQFESTLLHHPVPQFSDVSENRGKSEGIGQKISSQPNELPRDASEICGAAGSGHRRSVESRPLTRGAALREALAGMAALMAPIFWRGYLSWVSRADFLSQAVLVGLLIGVGFPQVASVIGFLGGYGRDAARGLAQILHDGLPGSLFAVAGASERCYPCR
jgi:hypothetical protein